FNVGNPANDVSIRDLAEKLAAVFALRVPGAEPARFRDVPGTELYGAGYDDSEDRVPDIARARAALDWEPQTTLDEMLPGIVDDYVLRYGTLLARAMSRSTRRSGTE